MRVRVNPYGASKSARELAKYLGVKRLLTTNSKFRGRYSDVVINWGIGKGNVGNARQINNLQNVQLASNKLSTLQKLKQNYITVPNFTTDKLSLVPTELYMARTTLTGHSGKGIVVGTPDELPEAPLYTKYIHKVAEYRAIVVGNEVVDFKQKLRKRDREHDEYVWNHSGGYVFARNDIRIPDGAYDIGIKSIQALGLDFGAVDIIEDEDGVLYVLEVNTAFGIEGTTLELVGNAIKELI
jgi:hypothetical protein